MSRRDLYDNLEYEQVRRSQRGLRPMSALGGIIDGFEQGYTAVDSFKRKKELEKQSDEDRREKKRDEEYDRTINDAAFEEYKKKNGLDPKIKSRKEFYKEWDEKNPLPKSEKSLLDKAVDYTSEKFGQTWRIFGFKDDKAATQESGADVQEPSSPVQQGGMGIEPPEEFANGGLIRRRGLLRAAEGTPGGVEEAAAAQGVQQPQSMGIAPQEPQPKQKGEAPLTTPYDDIAKANPKAAEFIRQMGQDPSANFKQIADEGNFQSLLELTKKAPNYGKLAEYAGVIKAAKDEGVFRMLQELEMQTKDKKTFEETKKKAIGYFNSMGKESGLVDVEAVPMTYKAPSGETLSYNRWRLKMDDGTTGLIDTRDLLMQVLSVKGLISQENQWTKDKFTREQIEEGKKDRAQRQSQQKSSERDSQYARNSRSIDALFEKEADAMLKVLPKPSNNVLAAIYGNNAGEEARKEMIGGLVRQTIADLRNTDAYRNLDDEATFKSFRSRLSTDFKEVYKKNEKALLDDRANQLGDMFIDANARLRDNPKAINEFVNENLAGLRMLVGKNILSAKDLKPGTAARAKLESFAVRANPKTKDEGGN